MALFSVLSSWLGRAKAVKRHFSDMAEFREFIIAAFIRQPGVDSATADPSDPAKLKITINGLSVTGDLTNIFGYIMAYPDEDTDKAIERFIHSITQDKAGAISDSQIVAVIRSREYIDYFKEQGLDFLSEQLGADLMITYMADRSDSMSPIAQKDVPDKDLQSIRKIALDNVRKWLPKVVSDNQLQRGILYYVRDNTMLSTSLILLDEFWKSIQTRFPGDVLIALPRRDQLFIFDDDPQVEAAARRLIDVTTHDNFNLLSSKLYARRNSKIVLA
jgi:uncharacterized protein YtpQ (UPF0354 family)